MKRELLDLKESTARHDHLNKSVKEKLIRDKEDIGRERDKLQAELQALKEEAREKERKRLEENEELGKLLEESDREKRRLQREKEEILVRADRDKDDKEERSRLLEEKQKLQSDLEIAQAAESAERNKLKKRLEEMEGERRRLTKEKQEAEARWGLLHHYVH